MIILLLIITGIKNDMVLHNSKVAYVSKETKSIAGLMKVSAPSFHQIK